MGTVTANEDFEYLIFPFTSRSVAENSRFVGRWEFKYLIPSTTIKVAMTFDNTNARLAVYNREDNAFPELDIIASLTEIRTTVNKRLYFLSINSFHRIHKIMSLSEIPILVEQWYRSTIGYRPWW
jgi:hypothetical protein